MTDSESQSSVLRTAWELFQDNPHEALSLLKLALLSEKKRGELKKCSELARALAMMMKQLEDYRSALGWFKAAIFFDAESASSHWGVGICAKELGNKDYRQYFSTAIQLDSSYEDLLPDIET